MVAKRLTFGFVLALSLGSLGACRAHVSATGSGHAHAEPVLVWVDGVWVVEDYQEPVFYHSHYYWRYDGGVWYRSSVHTGGWVRVDVVPDRVRVIDRPERFVRWHAEAGARKHTGSTPPPDEPEMVDDHPGRGNGPPDHAPAHGVRGPEPGHSDEKAEMKAEKAEAKAEAKADKAEAKADAKADKKADKAEKAADKAEAKADKAEVKADKAEKKADKAEAKADKAEVKSDKAEKKADKAQDKAAKAEVKADVKADKADKAKGKDK
jgi:hypothetical protein